jgi:hypothetical protein
MSKKQNEHNEAYHITDQNDYEKVFEKEEEVKEEKKEEEPEEEYDEVGKEANEIINTLEEIMYELKDVKKSDIQEVVETILTDDDKQELYSLYYKFFHDLPNNNSIKIYVLHLFNELCMPIKRNTTQFNELLRKMEEETINCELVEDEEEEEETK